MQFCLATIGVCVFWCAGFGWRIFYCVNNKPPVLPGGTTGASARKEAEQEAEGLKTIKPPSIIVNGLATALLKIEGGIIVEKRK